MRPVVVSRPAARDVDRLEDWLMARNPGAAIRAGVLLREAFASLSTLPERTIHVDGSEQRQLVRRFGKGTYVIRYVIRPEAIIVTRVWHSLEDRSG